MGDGSFVSAKNICSADVKNISVEIVQRSLLVNLREESWCWMIERRDLDWVYQGNVEMKHQSCQTTRHTSQARPWVIIETLTNTGSTLWIGLAAEVDRGVMRNARRSNDCTVATHGRRKGIRHRMFSGFARRKRSQQIRSGNESGDWCRTPKLGWNWKHLRILEAEMHLWYFA